MTGTQPPPYTPGAPLSPADERTWATLVHVGGIVIGFVSPLIGYLVLKDRSAFVAANSRNALNFQITLAIAYVAAAVLTVITFGIGGILYLPLWVLSIVFSIMGAVAANRGEVYRYPLTIAFVR